MPLRERRKAQVNGAPDRSLSGLTASQRGALASLRNLGWELTFVRHPLFQPPAVVIRDAEGRRFAILEPDGTITEQHGLKFRQPA
jgi:hypothetical protein